MGDLMTSMPQNYKNNVNWILGTYEDLGIAFPNGFQKDAIQNAVGARKTNKWKDWSCDIYLVENDHGCFVVVEDSGTVGLTGKNRHTNEIKKLMANGETLPPSERLSRFTSMFNSGGNKTGSGLFGAGKSVYSVASTTYTYYFDSLREDGLYVSNVNQCGQVMSLALEGTKAKKYILDNTGLTEKKTIGTRIIIEKPKKELVDSIRDKSIIPYIQESWWLIIQRLDSKSAIFVNHEPVLIPSGIKDGTHSFELQNSVEFAQGYRVKHFGFYVFDHGDNCWNGISYYRKGMKIGNIELRDVSDKIKSKFWGYIEVDEAWEDELAHIEDKVHFGVSKGKKNCIAYQYLKNFCNEKVKANLVEWGYVKDKENEDKKLMNELKEIAENLQDFFDKLGFEDLGKGPKKSDFDIRWQDVRFPEENSETVTIGDTIDFSVRIKSTYATDKKFEYKLYVLNPTTGELIYTIANDKVLVQSDTTKKINFNLKINKNNSVQFAENRIVLSVKVIGSGKEKRKELSYYFDIERPNNKRESVNLSLHECVLPTKGSRRVNFGEKINKICYKIENKRNCILNYKLNVAIHNASNPTCPEIVRLKSFTGIVKPFEEDITEYIDNVIFTKSIYESHLTEGILELRARLIANEDDDQYEKGDKITYYNFKIYLNCDEKNGKADAFNIQSVDAPENYKRSWCTPGAGRTIYLNVGHTSYLNVQDYPDFQYQYLREQMLKQYVLLYLNEGKYDMFNQNGYDFSNLEPQEAVEQVLEKIESIYAQSLK